MSAFSPPVTPHYKKGIINTSWGKKCFKYICYTFLYQWAFHKMKKSQNPQCNTNKQPPKPQAGDSKGTQKALNVFQKKPVIGLLGGCHKPTCWCRAMSPTVSLSAKGNNQLFDRNKGQLNRKSTSSGQMVTESSFTPPLSKNRLKRHFLLPSNSPKEGINLLLRVIPLLPDTHTHSVQSTGVVCPCLYFF